jgi:hypothetical protein
MDLDCAPTVHESNVFIPFGLLLSEKQIPQITENTEKSKYWMDLLESDSPCPRHWNPWNCWKERKAQKYWRKQDN